MTMTPHTKAAEIAAGLSRRGALKLGAAAVAASALPTVVLAQAATAFPAWAVGTPREYDWSVFHARSADAAKAMWCDRQGWHDPLEIVHALEKIEARDVSAMIGTHTAEGERGTDAEQQVAMGWEVECERHLDLVSSDFPGIYFVDGAVICADCIRPAELATVDPEGFVENYENGDYDDDEELLVLGRAVAHQLAGEMRDE